MPNWCDNTLTISGDNEAIKRFMEVGGDDWGLGKYYPMPEALENTISPPRDCQWANEGDIKYAEKNGGEIPEPIECNNGTKEKRDFLNEKYGVDNWYDWKIKNWGTKWDVDLIDVDENGFVSFLTAWSPPIEWLEKVAKDYPELTFHLSFMETGNWFAGILVMKGGEIIRGEQGEPVYFNEDGDTYTWDSDKGVYVSNENPSKVIPEDEWDGYEINPFDD